MLELSEYLKGLSARIILTPEAHQIREQLVEEVDLYKGMDLLSTDLNVFCEAYMRVSYSLSPKKHHAKTIFSSMVKATTDKIGSGMGTLENKPRTLVDRPTILVPVDRLSSVHAMYRVYGPAIRQLKQQFRLVAFAKVNELDKLARNLFEEIVVLPESQVVLSQVIYNILEAKPDMIYYPSVGMTPWWIIAANLRLAPIQLFTSGHPVTTGSPAIDYAPLEMGVSESKHYVERMAWMPLGTLQLLPYPGVPRLKVDRTPSPVKIAVAGMVSKLNVPFLQTLSEISQQVTVDHEFHFFPNTLGGETSHVQELIKRFLPNSQCHDLAVYPVYRDQLAQCHVQLTPFPFGNTNSTVDATLLEMPVVTLKGDDTLSRQDAWILERLSPRNAVVATQEEYVKLAVDLINLPDFRREFVYDVKVVEEILFGPRQGAAKNAFVKLFNHLYTYHEQIRDEVQLEDYL